KNIVKYSAASKIEVGVIQSNGSVNMRIFDNGKGFNVKTAKNGIGLSNIKKRAESFSGKFILNSAPGKGCEIIVAIPRGI
ncbi:MAG TPA: ATP-binding protein, partial [Ferruginibacter sp.]|nr:ATP-binding protein [Ferruginibacter sp.]